MSQSPPRPGAISPDDSLPPVEPPSAGFILQLFVVPGVIVVIIVMVWLMFNWLAQKGSDPSAYIGQLERNNAVRWQAAVNLANALRDPHNEEAKELKADPKMALKLAEILEREMNAGSKDENLVTLRVFLCRTLGEFKVTEGQSVLIKELDPSKEKHTEVRRAAIEALALLTENLRKAKPTQSLDDEKVCDALVGAAGHEDLRTSTARDDANRPEREEAARRSACAFALGVVGGEKCLNKLRSLLDDGDTDVRYNAATGLARHGDITAQDVLVEMLDPAAVEGLKSEKEAKVHEYKRAMILVNALRAGQQLARENPEADLAPLGDAVNKLLDADVPGPIRVAAKELKVALEERKK